MAITGNPYPASGGTRPPELVRRDDLRERLRVSIERVRIGRPAKNLIIVGLRGVGKTVLLNQMLTDAESIGIHAVYAEASEKRSLSSLVIPQLRTTLLCLSTMQASKDAAIRALRALSGFVKTLKRRYQDIEVDFDYEPEPGLADNGDLEGDFATLLTHAGEAARDARTAVVIFIDDLQYVAEPELAALITALHRLSQLNLPITVVGTGLPQMLDRVGSVKSYAERLFDYPEIGAIEMHS